ncbi:hypothetical protein ACIOC1_11700 [Streptomyces sp. NPDC088197]|uniref:hypothetical protein n=1 Tax=unclassified Streptomyces TaxID=2593676 RepID=UPI0033A19D13
MSAAGPRAGRSGPPAARGASPLRTAVTVGTLAANFLAVTKKIRRANGSPHAIDHIDLIASITTFVVLAVRARQGRESGGG